MSLLSFILPQKPRVVLWLGLLGHWRKKKWIDWEEDLACLALLNLLLPLISQTLSFSPPADPSHPCLYLFAPSIWFLSSPHPLLRSSQQTISLTFFAVYLPRPKQTVIFSFVLPPTFSLWGLCKGMENRRVTQIFNIHPIFRIITFHCVQNRKFTPYHAAYRPEPSGSYFRGWVKLNF